MRPKRIGLFASEIARAEAGHLALVARAVAAVVDQNLSETFDAKLAATFSGDTSPDMFKYIGVEWLELLILHGRLAPDHAILDIGCGVGRMAWPLAMYLSDHGAYHGFDPLEASIAFCQSQIKRANFRFDHIDLRHHLYRPDGVIRSETFRFPCEDVSVNVALAASVFTHIDLDTAKNYLRETRRVLKPGGRAIYSLFGLTREMMPVNGAVTRLLGKGDSFYAWRFRDRGAGFFTHCDEAGNPKNHYMPDQIGDPVAYELSAFTGMCKSADLNIASFLPGSWCRDEYVHSYQDIFVLE